MHNLKALPQTEPVKANTLTTVSAFAVEQGQSGNKTTRKSILPAATITLQGKRGRIVRKRGLLDTCAKRSFIRKSALEGLNYKSQGVETISLRGYLPSTPVKEYEMVNIAVPHRGRLLNMDCIAVVELPEYTKKFNVKNLRSLSRTKISLADKDFYLPVEKQLPIELLIGVDNVYILHLLFRKFENLIHLPTIFGYMITGTCSSPPTEETHVSILKLAVKTNNIIMAEGVTNLKDPKEDLETLWSLHHLGTDYSEITEQEQKVLENSESTITYSETDEQYVVTLPWKGNKGRLASNFGLDLNRLKQVCQVSEEHSVSSTLPENPEGSGN
ncbi:uncharacterized protein [Macrobrachium rosenbergii]|uniref:uncharacterized protein n=1 Tax=Macrobrachium rosenbergii TaxID=79674 RepID=UPI0034D76B1A